MIPWDRNHRKTFQAVILLLLSSSICSESRPINSSGNQNATMVVRVIVSSSSSSDGEDEFIFPTIHTTTRAPKTTTKTTTTTEKPRTFAATTFHPPLFYSSSHPGENIFSVFYRAFHHSPEIMSDSSHVERFQIFPSYIPPPPSSSPKSIGRSQVARTVVTESKSISASGRAIEGSRDQKSFRRNPPKNHFHSHQPFQYLRRKSTTEKPITTTIPVTTTTTTTTTTPKSTTTTTPSPPIVSNSDDESLGYMDIPRAEALIQIQMVPKPLRNWHSMEAAEKVSWAEPEKVWGQPEKVWSEPTKVWGEPEKVWSEPEKNWGEPERVWGDSKKLWKKEKEKEEEKDENVEFQFRRISPKIVPTTEKGPPVYELPPKAPSLHNEDGDEETKGAFVELGEDEGEAKSWELPELGPQADPGLVVGANEEMSEGEQPKTTVLPKREVNSKTGKKFGYVLDQRDVKKYRVEERTADGYIVGEYGVINHDNGFLRGVRYTADGTINPRLIHEALMKFLSL